MKSEEIELQFKELRETINETLINLIKDKGVESIFYRNMKVLWIKPLEIGFFELVDTGHGLFTVIDKHGAQFPLYFSLNINEIIKIIKLFDGYYERPQQK